MCGICGAISMGGALDPAIRAALPGMRDALEHRGPDDTGEILDGRAALGHRRLSIIDVAHGRQPIFNETGNLAIIFNGEIYNHRELRAALEARGHVFRTRSDTEAVLHAYEEYGTGCLARLNGMFAFAIYDRRSGEGFLARDRLGKKPLYYAILGGALHFASELKALKRSPAWRGVMCPDQVLPYFLLGFLPAADTIYAGVRKLEPGCWLRLRDGQIQTGCYWDVEEFDTGEDESKLGPLLQRCVEDRLEAEVPLGAFLSGGIDSGLVVAAMRKATDRAPITCTVGFDDVRYNELDAAERTARHVGADHHAAILHVEPGQILDRIIEGFDEPFADASAIPTWHVCRMARRHVTVSLSGDGGDETFGGYGARYLPHAWEDHVRRRLAWAGGAFGALGRIWPRREWLPRALRLATIARNLSGSAADAYFWDLCSAPPGELAPLFGKPRTFDGRGTAIYETVVAPYHRCPSRDAIQRAAYADLKIYLPDDVCAKVDRMSMQHGLEVRCPLLDHRLVEYAFRLPMARKMPRLEPKGLLRRLGRSLLPGEILALKKHGFTAPVASWLRGELRDAFRDEALAADAHARDHVEIRVLQRWFDEHQSGSRDRSYVLWAAWVFERWLRKEGRANPPAAASVGPRRR